MKNRRGVHQHQFILTRPCAPLTNFESRQPQPENEPQTLVMERVSHISCMKIFDFCCMVHQKGGRVKKLERNHLCGALAEKPLNNSRALNQ